METDNIAYQLHAQEIPKSFFIPCSVFFYYHEHSVILLS